MLLRGVAPDTLWRELPAQFAVSEPQAHCDTLRFLSALHHLGLLTLPKAERTAAPETEDDNDDVAPASPSQPPEAPEGGGRP